MIRTTIKTLSETSTSQHAGAVQEMSQLRNKWKRSSISGGNFFQRPISSLSCIVDQLDGRCHHGGHDQPNLCCRWFHWWWENTFNVREGWKEEEKHKKLWSYGTYDSFAGYKKSGFSESSFDQAEGMKEMEEDFFPHEDLVRWNMPMVKCQSSKKSDPGWRRPLPPPEQIQCRQMLWEFGDLKVDTCF